MGYRVLVMQEHDTHAVSVFIYLFIYLLTQEEQIWQRFLRNFMILTNLIVILGSDGLDM